MTTFYSFTLIVAITIVIRGEFSDGYRILGVFPLNGKSHFTMLEMLMKSLAKKGHQVDVINHFPLKKPFPNYKDYSLYGLLPDLVNNVSYDLMQTFTSSSMKQFVHNAGDKICNLLSHPSIKNIIKNPPNDPPYDLVIVEVISKNSKIDFIICSRVQAYEHCWRSLELIKVLCTFLVSKHQFHQSTEIFLSKIKI